MVVLLHLPAMVKRTAAAVAALTALPSFLPNLAMGIRACCGWRGQWTFPFDGPLVKYLPTSLPLAVVVVVLVPEIGVAGVMVNKSTRGEEEDK